MGKDIQEQTKKLLEKNRRSAGRYEYTVPSPEIYPFQWLWDSCFHAIMLSHFDIEQAKKELRSVIAKPLGNGLLPHINYWNKEDAAKNWGKELRGDIITKKWGTNGTSSITQPPIIAVAALEVYKKDKDIRFFQEIYPTLYHYYNYLLFDRDPQHSHLLGIINPDESGEDNSPRFDDILNLKSKHTHDENLDKRIELIDKNRLCRFDAPFCMKDHFWIKDVPFNAIMVKGLEALCEIADIIGEPEQKLIFEEHKIKIAHAMRSNMFNGDVYQSVDEINGTTVSSQTWAIFMPLYAKLLTQDEAELLVDNHLRNTEEFWGEFPVPSTSFKDPAYAKDGFWRGPVWMASNWFIYKGLKNYGFDDIAEELKEKTRKLIEQSGFREQYDPHTGEGLGAKEFTWAGLYIDMN